MEEGEVRDTSGLKMISFQMPDIIPLLEIENIIESDDLMYTPEFFKYYEVIENEPAEERYFDDSEELNYILDRFPDKIETMAQMLALNESFVGFVQLLQWWVQANEELTE